MRLRLFAILSLLTGAVSLGAVVGTALSQHPKAAAAAAAAAPLAARADDAPEPKPKGQDEKKPRGLKKTPAHKIAGAKAFSPKGITLPASVVYVPKQLSMWGNDKYGDCVSAEEAFNQAALGSFIPEATVVAWARSNGYLNGADLTEVMDSMRRSGFKTGGNTYSIGSYSSVNFTDEPTLQAALTLGPVKTGIDADALPSGAGNHNGWYATGGQPGQFSNEDHCVPIMGYGPATTLFSALNAPVPAGFSTSKTYYLVGTWSTIGVVDHDWIMSTMGEAWVRNPSATVNGQPQPNPNPPPGPTPNPNPGPGPQPNPNPQPVGPGFSGSVTYTYTNGVLTGITTGAAGSIEADLKAAGVNPVVIVDVLTLLADIKAKKDKSVIFADVLKIVMDFATP